MITGSRLSFFGILNSSVEYLNALKNHRQIENQINENK